MGLLFDREWSVERMLHDDDATMLEAASRMYTERIPFNKLLGIEITSLSFEDVSIKIPFRDELVGNYIRGSLHGGVVSAVLDLTGGLVAFLSALKGAHGTPPQEKMERLARVGTIDMRVDYLRPGLGAHFLCSAYVLRTGNKVAVTRMELVNDEATIIAVGTAAYLVG